MQRFAAGALVAVVSIVLGPVPAHSDITIATAGPFTGHNIFLGEQIQHGAEMAVEDINAAGGVLGQRVELLIEDDACDAEQAVAVARKLVNDGAVFVAGHVCSHSSIPASRVYEEGGVLMISPSSTNPALTDEGGDNVFRVCGRDDQQGIVAAAYLADAWSDARIAIIHDGSSYGEGLAIETRRQLHDRGVIEAFYEGYAPKELTYAPLIARLEAAAIDVAYIGGYSPEAGLIVRQARDRGYDAQFVSGDAVTNEEFWMIAGPAGDGTLVTFGVDPRQYASAALLVERFRDRGFEPVGYTLYTYAAVQVWAAAVERAGSLALDAVTEELWQGSFDTVLGTIGFDRKGDVTAAGYSSYIWRGGEYRPATAEDLAAAVYRRVNR